MISIVRNFARVFLWLVVGCLLVLATYARAEVQLPQLKTRSDIYTNVTVTSQTETDLYIKHERGIGNVKIADIQDDEALYVLGLKERPKTAEELAKIAPPVTPLSLTNEPLKELANTPLTKEAWTARLDQLRGVRVPMQMLAIVLGVVLVMHLFWSYCLKLICVKTGSEPGALVWLPILQMIPAFKAAGMSGWWLLALFVPLLNLVAILLWDFKIVKARSKSVIWGILLLLPATNVIAILYLAFSSAGEAPAQKRKGEGKK